MAVDLWQTRGSLSQLDGVVESLKHVEKHVDVQSAAQRRSGCCALVLTGLRSEPSLFVKTTAVPRGQTALLDLYTQTKSCHDPRCHLQHAMLPCCMQYCNFTVVGPTMLHWHNNYGDYTVESQQLLSYDPDEVSPFGKPFWWQSRNLLLGVTLCSQVCCGVSNVRRIDLKQAAAQAAHEGLCMNIYSN